MDKSSQIATVAAVIISTVSLGLSAWAIGCHSSQDSRVARNDVVASIVAPALASQSAAPPAIVVQTPVVPSAQPAQPVAVKEAAREPAKLRVKRLVVARGVENHEPVDISDSFRIENKPLYAFIELENGSSGDGEVLVVFEKGSKRTGMVELSVPGNAKRWRTWGRSHGIKEAGQWFAVVRGADGKELARTPFSIES